MTSNFLFFIFNLANLASFYYFVRMHADIECAVRALDTHTHTHRSLR